MEVDTHALLCVAQDLDISPTTLSSGCCFAYAGDSLVYNILPEKPIGAVRKMVCFIEFGIRKVVDLRNVVVNPCRTRSPGA